MSSLFSSPSKEAGAAAQAEQGLTAADMQQLEGYVNQTEGQERGAIAGLGTNPYFQAAGNMSPSNYAVNPADTVTFSNQGPGTTASAPSSATTPPNLFTPPPETGPAPGGTGAPGVPPSSPISQPPINRQPVTPTNPVGAPPPYNPVGPILNPGKHAEPL